MSEQQSVPSIGDEAGLQPERTGLAWNRTLVVLAAAFGILGVHAYLEGLHVGLMALSGVIAAVILIISSPIARARSHRAADLMDGTARFMTPIPLLALSGISLALALASGALIILRG
jgi:uncharacterized membrane protein YidH (DUF202 family)